MADDHLDEVYMPIRHTFSGAFLKPAAILIGGLLFFCTPASLKAESSTSDYVLGPQDKVRISAHEWRSARNEAYEWSALKGEFTIGPGGTLSLPLIGEVSAVNLRTDELANLISQRLQAKVGLAQRPDTAVQIIEFRPLYVMGNVSKPGEYPFRPGVTALQAISIAGGFYRPADIGLMRLEREAIVSTGELRVIASERKALALRLARLQAELAGTNSVTLPVSLQQGADDPTTREILNNEQMLLQSRRDSLNSQVQSINQANGILEAEVQALKAKDITQERQLGLAKKEQQDVNSLVSRGLAVTPRVLSLEQTVAQIEGARQDLTLSILRAQQEILRNQRAAKELRSQRSNEILLEIQETGTKLGKLSEQAKTNEQMVRDTQLTAPQLIEEQEQREAREPVLKVVRRNEGGPREIVADSAMLLQPGDILKVERGGTGSRLPTQVHVSNEGSRSRVQSR